MSCVVHPNRLALLPTRLSSSSVDSFCTMGAGAWAASGLKRSRRPAADRSGGAHESQASQPKACPRFVPTCPSRAIRPAAAQAPAPEPLGTTNVNGQDEARWLHTRRVRAGFNVRFVPNEQHERARNFVAGASHFSSRVHAPHSIVARALRGGGPFARQRLAGTTAGCALGWRTPQSWAPLSDRPQAETRVGPPLCGARATMRPRIKNSAAPKHEQQQRGSEHANHDA